MWHREKHDLPVLQTLARFLQSLCLTTTGPQSTGTGLEGVSCRGGLLTRNVLLLPLHRLSQVWPCYKHEKLYVQQSRLRGSPRILKRSRPCKLCFKPAPGGCTGRAGAGALLWGPGGIQPGENAPCSRVSGLEHG